MGTRDVLVEGAGREQREDFVGLGFGMQEQSQESCCSHKGIMVLPQHHHPHKSDWLPTSSSSPSSSFCYGHGGGSTTNGGPMFCASSNQFASCMGDMNGLVGSVSGGGAGASATAHNNTSPSFTLGSYGEKEAPLNGEVSFSAAQWQELERQTTIYKYMMASASVPGELLVPITKNSSNANQNVVRGSSLKLGVPSNSSNSSDPEPWRCRRTDGKKWRCSRDVVPDQKYCERHSHKSRPRSRKPVELPPNFTSIDHNTAKNNIDQFASGPIRTYHQNPQFINLSETHFPVYSTLAAASSAYDQPRDLKWFMKEDTVSVSNTSNQDLQQIVQTNLGLSREHSKFGGEIGFDNDQPYRPNNQLEIPSLGSVEGLLNLNQTHTQEPRHFIDAWSKADKDITSIEPIGTNCYLTLSMAGSGEFYGNEGMENGQMGARHPWMSQEGLWMGSPPGGPLAEALCIGVPNSAKGGSSGCSISSTSTSSCSKTSN